MLAANAEQLSTSVQLHLRLALEQGGVLQALLDQLGQLSAQLAPIHERATALTEAEQNITATRSSVDELLRHIETSRQVRTLPGRLWVVLTQAHGLTASEVRRQRPACRAAPALPSCAGGVTVA
jgi:hypothetical protein